MQCGGLVCDSPGVSGTAHNDRTYSHSMTQLNVFAFLQQNGQLFTLRGLNKELLIASVQMRFHHQIRVTFSCKISLQNKQQTTFSFRAFRISTESTGEHSVITLRNDSSVETGGRTRWKQRHPVTFWHGTDLGICTEGDGAPGVQTSFSAKSKGAEGSSRAAGSMQERGMQKPRPTAG